MKKTIGILLIGLFPLYLLAQVTPLSSLYEDYASKSGYKSAEMRPGSMSFEWERSTDFPEIREILKNIESIRILLYQPESGQGSPDKLWKKILKAASDERYTEVVTLNAEDVQLRMYILKGPDNVTKEAALCVRDKKGVMLGAMSGNLDFSSLLSAQNMQALREMGEYFIEQKGSCTHEKH